MQSIVNEMKLASMQPYFFPYIGYFQLIVASDLFIIFDIVQYIDKGWMNRNRILNSNLDKEWSYISVPISKHSYLDPISKIRINDSIDWRGTIFGKLTYYKKIRAPYYNDVITILENIFMHKYEHLTDLNICILEKICNYINVRFNYKKCSEVNLDFSNVQSPGDWALEESKQLNAQVYINNIGGQNLYDAQKFSNNNIILKFITQKNIEYKQSKRKFVPWLSIIDIMMFNSKEQIGYLLEQYSLE